MLCVGKACAESIRKDVDSLLENTAVAKCGYSTEVDSRWNSRANTFSPLPTHHRQQCLNIDKTKENGQAIEKLMFCILTRLGLKLPASAVKTNQSEFFKAFVKLGAEAHVCCVINTITAGWLRHSLIVFHLLTILFSN